MILEGPMTNLPGYTLFYCTNIAIGYDNNRIPIPGLLTIASPSVLDGSLSIG